MAEVPGLLLKARRPVPLAVSLRSHPGRPEGPLRVPGATCPRGDRQPGSAAPGPPEPTPRAPSVLRTWVAGWGGRPLQHHFRGRFSGVFAGPEAGGGPNEVTLQVPRPSASRAEPPSSPSAQSPGDGVESPVVQSDEEGVEVDTALATLHTDDSDS